MVIISGNATQIYSLDSVFYDEYLRDFYPDWRYRTVIVFFDASHFRDFSPGYLVWTVLYYLDADCLPEFSPNYNNWSVFFSFQCWLSPGLQPSLSSLNRFILFWCWVSRGLRTKLNSSFFVKLNISGNSIQVQKFGQHFVNADFWWNFKSGSIFWTILIYFDAFYRQNFNTGWKFRTVFPLSRCRLSARIRSRLYRSDRIFSFRYWFSPGLQP